MFANAVRRCESKQLTVFNETTSRKLYPVFTENCLVLFFIATSTDVHPVFFNGMSVGAPATLVRSELLRTSISSCNPDPGNRNTELGVLQTNLESFSLSKLCRQCLCSKLWTVLYFLFLSEIWLENVFRLMIQKISWIYSPCTFLLHCWNI